MPDPNSPETRVADALSFLLDRLSELDWSQSKADIERDFHGHVVPASARASDVLAALPEAATIEQVARAIDSVQLFWLFNDWTSDRVEGLPIEICRYGGEDEPEIVVVRRAAGSKEDGQRILSQTVSKERALAAISTALRSRSDLRAARICDLYADWCGGWGQISNERAATEGARECAKMLRLFPADIVLPDDDEDAGDVIVRWLQANKIDTKPDRAPATPITTAGDLG